MRPTFTKACVRVLSAIVAIAAGSGMAHAQAAAWQITEPSTSWQSVEKMMDTMGLNAAQRAATRSLFDGLREELQRKSRRLRAIRDDMEAHVPAEDPGARRAEFEKLFGEFVVAKSDAESRFFGDFETVLTPEQDANAWPGAMRDFRRAQLRHVPWSGLARWSRVDLAACAEQANLGDDARLVQDAIESWKLEVDVPLVERDAMWRREMHVSPEEQKNAAPDMEEHDLALGRRVESINRKYFRILMEQLPPESGARLANLVLNRAYPIVFGSPRPARDLFQRALADDTLDQRQRTALTDLREKYDAESATLDREGQAACDKAGDDQAAFNRLPEAERAARPDGPANPERAVADALSLRREQLESKIVRSIGEILTPEQLERIQRPAKPGEEPETP